MRNTTLFLNSMSKSFVRLFVSYVVHDFTPIESKQSRLIFNQLLYYVFFLFASLLLNVPFLHTFYFLILYCFSHFMSYSTISFILYLKSQVFFFLFDFYLNSAIQRNVLLLLLKQEDYTKEIDIIVHSSPAYESNIKYYSLC